MTRNARICLTLMLLPLLLTGCSGSNVTTTMARRDDLSISLVSARVNIGSRIQISGCSLNFTGLEGHKIENVRWTIWQDKNGDGVCQAGEEMQPSGGNRSAKDSHSFTIADIDVDSRDQRKVFVTYSADGANGPISRTTSLGSLLP